VDIARPTWVSLDRDSWGLDHGTWSVLVHAFPDAEIPVVRLSVNAAQPLDGGCVPASGRAILSRSWSPDPLRRHRSGDDERS
jgi:aromatic ring-opening dioxygenase catalytic subunit (LigB family)